MSLKERDVMYQLYMPIIDEKDTELPTIQFLFKEVFGYNDNEIQHFTKTKFDCTVAINLTLEQAKQITSIFLDNDIQIYLVDQKTNKYVFWRPDLGIIIPRNPPKDHYCDEPIISREHLVDAFTQQAIDIQHQKATTINNSSSNTITVKCPYCESTNTTKITTASKAIHTAFFGIFSMGRNNKQWHCNKCGSDF